MNRLAALWLILGLCACGDSQPLENNNGNDNEPPRCGDGTLDPGESCDNGEANSDLEPDACRLDCTPARCGDGVTDSGERCDDGNTLSGDSCRGDCLQDMALCGNGSQDPGEACDEGEANSWEPNAPCRPDCQAGGCGDGVLDDLLGEECDDGDLASHDGCSSGCTSETSAWLEISPGQTPDGGEGVALAYDSARGRLVLFGGGPEGAYFGQTWEFDGERFWEVTTDISPVPRKHHTMAYDSARGVVVLFGGMSHSSEYRDDTWEYDGTTWVETTPPVSPGARNQHAMVYDSARGVVVLFGGLDPSYLGDTWEYDGQVWLQRSSPTAPAPRRSASMAFDAARGRTVLYGGVVWESDQWHYSADTWEWDGSSWEEVTPTGSPTGLEGHSLAYDAAQARVVLFGGERTSLYFGETWLFDGSSWTQETYNPAPGARARHGLGRASTGLLLFGGYSPDYPFFPEDTWVYSPQSDWPDEQCSDGGDLDGDGLAGCADPDCNGRSCGAGICQGGVCR